jgi:O-antigen ligase
MKMVAIAVTLLVMLAFFWLLRERGARGSWALWLPIAWMCIAGSRSVSSWFGVSGSGTLAQTYSEGTPLDAAIFLFLILCGLFVLNRRAARLQSFTKGNGALIAFYAFCGVSVMWSAEPAVAFKHWIKLFGDLEMALLVLTDPQPRMALRTVMARVGIILLMASIMLIVAFPELGRSIDSYDFRQYLNGVTTQKNELGMICIVLGLGAEWGFLEGMRLGSRQMRIRQCVGNGILFLAALGLIIAANSMTSFSCLLLSGALMLMVCRPRVAKRRGLPDAIFWGAVILAIFAVFFDTSGTLVKLLGRNPSLTGRTKIWSAVLSFETNPLIGTGFDSFWLGDRIDRVANYIGYKGIAEAHNGYLEIYINMGWLGLLFLGVMLAAGYRRILRGLPGEPVYGSLRLAFYSASLMYSLSEAGFRKLNLIWIALLIALIELPRAGQESAMRKPLWRLNPNQGPAGIKVLR